MISLDYDWKRYQPMISKKSFGAAAIGALVGAFLLTPFFGGLGIWIGFFLEVLPELLIIEFIQPIKIKGSFPNT